MTTFSITQLNWADFCIIGIIFLSTLISFARGFVREAISLATWIIAIWIAIRFAPAFANLLIKYVHTPSIRFLIAFAALFILVLIIGSLINFLFSGLIDRTGLNGTDRLIGIIFGIVRGILLVGVLVLLGNMANLNKETWWVQSQLIPYFQGIAHWLQSFVPNHLPNLSQSFVMSPEGPK